MAPPYNKKIDKLDRISELPEPVILDIISRLPLKDSARASVLSKTWKSFCGLYPILYFDHNIFALQSLVSTTQDVNQIRDMFMDDVDYHLSKAHQLNSPIQKLAFTVSINDSNHFSRVDTWLELVKRIDVEDLCFYVQHVDFIWRETLYNRSAFYEFPVSVLASKGLRSVYVRGCRLRCDTFVGESGVPFFSLQRLCLLNVYMSEEVLECLIRFCQGIETLVFESCILEIDFLKLSEFPKLKKAVIQPGEGWMDYIDIVGTNLECFKCEAEIECLISPEACANMRELALVDCIINQPYLFTDLTATFPLIEEVQFLIHEIDTIKAESNVLRKLKCRSKELHHVKKIHIDCPNLMLIDCWVFGLTDLYVNCPKLRQFLYNGNTVPERLFFSSTADLEKSSCSIATIDACDTLWCINLRAFLELIMGSTTYVYLAFALPMATFKPEEVEALHASPQQNVYLNITLSNSDMQDVSALVDAMLWIIRPTVLSFRCSTYHLVKYLCENLINKFQDSICEEQLTHPCWLHQLEEFEVEYPLDVPVIKENLPTLLEQCQTEIGYIYFRFHWVYKGDYDKSEIMSSLVKRRETPVPRPWDYAFIDP